MTEQIIPNDEYNENFNPTERMRIAKSKFWEYIKNNNIDYKKLNREAICDIIGTKTFIKWRVDADFRAWFFEEKLENLQLKAAAELAIKTLNDILKEENNPKIMNAKVKAAQILLDYGGYAPEKKVVEKVVDKNIANMNEEELLRHIKGSLPSILDSLSKEELDELLKDKIKLIEGDNE